MMLAKDEGRKKIDWWFLLPVFLLGVIGVVTLYSASVSEVESLQQNLCVKQMIWFSGGLVLILVSLLFDHKSLYEWAEGIYFISLVLLAAVFFIGVKAGGASRWLPLGPFSIQPSEFVKLALIIMLAKHYSKQSNVGGLTFRNLILPILILGIPVVLIAMQPDLGTATLLILIAAFMTLIVGIARRTLYLLAGVIVVFIPILWIFFLHDYQKERVLTFLNPSRDPLETGYQIIQSKIAIGSGMITGKGFLNGTQNVLAFLPEQHTDFILAVLAEEWGFVGTSIVLFLYLLIIVWAVSIGYNSRDSFRILLSVGLTAMIFLPVFVNAGMVMGLLPVVGVPLPLISYGGSATVSFMLGIALLLNISMRRSAIE